MLIDLTLLYSVIENIMNNMKTIYVIEALTDVNPHVPPIDQWLKSGCLVGVRISKDTLQVVELSVRTGCGRISEHCGVEDHSALLSLFTLIQNGVPSSLSRPGSAPHMVLGPLSPSFSFVAL